MYGETVANSTHHVGLRSIIRHFFSSHCMLILITNTKGGFLSNAKNTGIGSSVCVCKK